MSDTLFFSSTIHMLSAIYRLLVSFPPFGLTHYFHYTNAIDARLKRKSSLIFGLFFNLPLLCGVVFSSGHRAFFKIVDRNTKKSKSVTDIKCHSSRNYSAVEKRLVLRLRRQLRPFKSKCDHATRLTLFNLVTMTMN